MADVAQTKQVLHLQGTTVTLDSMLYQTKETSNGDIRLTGAHVKAFTSNSIIRHLFFLVHKIFLLRPTLVI